MVEVDNSIYLESRPQLILFHKKGDNPQLYLKCPYEDFGPESVYIDMLPEIPQTARVKLDAAGRRGSYDVTRNLFISQTNIQKIVTMTAEYEFYTRGVEIEVFSWKDKSGKYSEQNNSDRVEINRIKTVRQVVAEFVSGYENAVRVHGNRVGDLKLNDITPQEGQEIYEAMLWTVPK